MNATSFGSPSAAKAWAMHGACRLGGVAAPPGRVRESRQPISTAGAKGGERHVRRDPANADERAAVLLLDRVEPTPVSSIRRARATAARRTAPASSGRRKELHHARIGIERGERIESASRQLRRSSRSVSIDRAVTVPASIEHVADQAVGELRLEPGRFRRHDRAGVGDGDQVGHLRRVEREGRPPSRPKRRAARVRRARARRRRSRCACPCAGR